MKKAAEIQTHRMITLMLPMMQAMGQVPEMMARTRLMTLNSTSSTTWTVIRGGETCFCFSIFCSNLLHE
ncbi:hypothetical protein RHMOL_Rhmol10G0177300 [Rhododendron molle]|uniref:Uncharacterized protein n=1 Tax=Rhododendron molle TaxID=49168 RepID=A0ACC0M4I7_RHOML|nr:hypothetical protein RHMOL_Rhmol10G0177300 [Rhododendron molle]